MSGWNGGGSGPGGVDPRTGLPDLSYMYSGNKLSKDFTLGDNKYATGQGHIDTLSKMANNKGLSGWANAQNKITDRYTMQADDQVNRNASAAYGGGMSNLASSGGLDAGSRERLASTSGLGRMQNLQSVNAQGNMSKMQTGLHDQAQKMDILKQLPGMQLQQGAFKAGLDQFDVNNNIGMGKMIYGEGVKYQSGKDLAEATAKSNQTSPKWYEKGSAKGSGDKVSQWWKKIHGNNDQG